MDLVSCPRCGDGIFDPSPIADGFAACTACGHRAATAYLGELVWLEQNEKLLGARLTWVREQIRAGTPVPPPSGAVPLGPVPHVAGPAFPRSVGPTPGARGGVQSLLLAAGALLLVTAATVFVTVTWDQLGPGGQLTALGVVIAVLSAGAHTARQRFRGTAETLAAVAACVTLLAMLAAPHLGLVPAHWHQNGAVWSAVSFAVTSALAVTLGVLSGLRAKQALTCWRVAAVGAIAATAQSLVIASAGGSDVSPAGPVVLAVAAAALLRLRPARTKRYGSDLLALGYAVGVLALLDGLAAYGHLDRAGWWSAAWSLISACVVAVATAPGPAAPAPAPGPAAPGPVPGPAVPGLAVPARPAAGSTPIRVVLAVGLGQALVLAVHAAIGNPAVALPVLAVLGSAVLASTLRPGWEVAGATAAGTIWALSLPISATPDGFGHHELSPFLGILAAAGYAMALVPRRAFAAWIAAVPACLSVWIELAAAEVSGPERYSFSAAGLLLLAGLLVRRQNRQADSVTVLGPALAMALVPSALIAFAEAADSGAGTLRAVLVIVGGSVVAVSGAAGRIKAPFLIGVIAAALAGLGQVFALANVVPRWVSLGVGGALLVATGFAAEAVRTAGREFRVLTGRMR
jgi:hypothetical protein